MACTSPVTRNRDKLFRVPVACGQCTACRFDRATSWTVRILHEAQTTRHELGLPSSFITLTYDDDHLPAGGTLVVKHWQDFAKRVRRAHGPFRFYACGEYGGRFGRAHYHAIVFGLDWSHDRVLHKRGKFGDLYRSESLAERWGKGFASVGSVTQQSAAYVAGYCMKKITGAAAKEYYGGRKPEFALMSRGGRGGRGGLGSSWLSRYKSDIYPSDETVVNGKRLRTPRYYDSKLSEAELEAVKAKRRDLAAQFASTLTRERLEAREYILQQRVKSRDLL